MDALGGIVTHITDPLFYERNVNFVSEYIAGQEVFIPHKKY